MKRRIWCLVIMIAASYACCAWFRQAEAPAGAVHLERIPEQLGHWSRVRDLALDEDSARVLRADGVLSRVYELAPGPRVQLFIAYYRSQHAGESMHSPRNCLPGSGWEPLSSSVIAVNMGAGAPRKVNRYLVERGGQKLLVIYWYQEQDRILSDEFEGKFYLVWDSLRHARRDGAIVRVTTTLNGLDEEQATKQLAMFIQTAVPEIRRAFAY